MARWSPDDPARPAGSSRTGRGRCRSELSEDGRGRPNSWPSTSTRASRRRVRQPAARARETAARSPSHALDMRSSGVAEWDRHSLGVRPGRGAEGGERSTLAAMLRGEWAGDESPSEFRGRVLAPSNSHRLPITGQRIAVVCHGGGSRVPVARPRPGAFPRGSSIPTTPRSTGRRGASGHRPSSPSTRRATSVAPVCRWVCSRG